MQSQQIWNTPSHIEGKISMAVLPQLIHVLCWGTEFGLLSRYLGNMLSQVPCQFI